MLNKIFAVLKNPRLGYVFCQYKISPILTLNSGASVTEFADFNEYWGTIRNQPDREEMAFIRKTLRGGGRVIDVGANIGVFSLATLTQIPDARVIAFEPSPFNFSRLKDNIERNGFNACLCQKAISSNTAQPVMKFAETKDSPSTMHFAEATSDSSIEVCVTYLDAYCEEHNISEIDLLKIDVEGYECDVLLGAEQLLRRGAAKTVYIEVCPGNLKRAGSSVQILWDTWVQFGYQAFHIRFGS